MTVFSKILDAATKGHGVQLTFADVCLLQSVLGDELGRAEGEYDRWHNIVKEYERNAARESEPEC